MSSLVTCWRQHVTWGDWVIIVLDSTLVWKTRILFETYFAKTTCVSVTIVQTFFSKIAWNHLRFFFSKSMFSRNFHNMSTLCGNYGILSPPLHFFQKFREINFSQKNFILNWFDEKKKNSQSFFFSFIFMDLEITQYPRVFIPCIYLHTWASI